MRWFGREQWKATGLNVFDGMTRRVGEQSATVAPPFIWWGAGREEIAVMLAEGK